MYISVMCISVVMLGRTCAQRIKVLELNVYFEAASIFEALWSTTSSIDFELHVM